MHEIYNRNRVVRIFCSFACLLLLLIIGCGRVYAVESTDIQCDIKWDYDIDRNVFTIHNATACFPNQPILRCIVSLYEENGRMISCGMSERSDNGTLYVTCTPHGTFTAHRVRFFFLDEYYKPISSAATYTISITEPTCTKFGYVEAVSGDGSSAQTIKTIPPRGHVYSDAVISESPDSINCGYSIRNCLNCTHAETTPIYPECPIARLCMYGNLTGIGKKSEVPITVSFDGEGKEIDCYALLKYQGHTSLVYEKKNYTLKLFNDSLHIQKNKITFFDWNKEHKYILKANYIDSSVCRNIVCANVWSEMVSSREGYPSRLDDCSNYGATDGFPLALYLNDEFQGLYTFTLHRDDDLFDMEDGQEDAILVVNTANTDAAFFKSSATFDSASDWEVEFSGLEDTSWAEDKLNALIDFVMTSSDTEFYTSLDQHLDVNSALDYLIAIYALGLTNSGAKNITLATYDNGVLFFSLCDMENAFGLSVTGNSVLLPSEFLPSCVADVWDSATGSLLWDRILTVYQSELCLRYTELRDSILTTDNVCGKVSDFLDPISQALFDADQTLYPEKPQMSISPKQQIKEYAEQRFALLDELFLIRGLN